MSSEFSSLGKDCFLWFFLFLSLIRSSTKLSDGISIIASPLVWVKLWKIYYFGFLMVEKLYAIVQVGFAYWRKL
jgi:hypothetical protein